MFAKDYIKSLTNEKYADIFNEMYCNEKLLYQNKRYISLLQTFIESFGDAEDTVIVSSPGRTEICGNHIDHQRGNIFSATVNIDMIAVANKTDNASINITSDGKRVFIENINTYECVPKTPEALVIGVVRELEKKGYIVGGFNATITSDVLVGSGLSSSAAFENLIGKIISGLYNEDSVTVLDVAVAGLYAEKNYYGKPCGLMDQMVISVGGASLIDFYQEFNPTYRNIDFNLSKYNMSLCIVDTKSSHAGDGEFDLVPKEYFMVAHSLGKTHLIDVDEGEFYEKINVLRKELGDRPILRAMHFFEENKRVRECVKAIENEDVGLFLDVIRRSGNSSFKYLQNVYSNKCVERQDLSIALALSEKILGDKGVCRLHGGGFGGTIQAFVLNEFVNEYKEKIETYFGENSCQVLQIRKRGTIII